MPAATSWRVQTSNVGLNRWRSSYLAPYIHSSDLFCHHPLSSFYANVLTLPYSLLFSLSVPLKSGEVAAHPPRKNTLTELRNSARKNRGAGTELQCTPPYYDDH